MSDGLKKLANVPVEYEVAGRTLYLTPMKLLSALRAQEIVEPFVHDLVSGDETINVTRLSMRYALKMFELCVVMLGEKERAWLESLDEESYEALLWKLVGVNSDFFGRRVRAMTLARLQHLLPREDGKSTSLGASPSQTPSDATSEPQPGPTPSAP
jgi:hypothetical protein